MSYKYLLLPGIVRSRNDGDYHHIGRRNLIDLYGVKPRDCLLYAPGRIDKKLYAKLIKLYPREDGRYERIER